MARNGINSQKLSPKQLKAIGAMLLCQTLPEAAAMTGVSVRTLSRWKEQPAFQEALKVASNSVMDEAVRRLVAGWQVALDTLYRIMTEGKREADQRIAAVAWLDETKESVDLENHEIRITAIEEFLNEYRKKVEHGRKYSRSDKYAVEWEESVSSNSFPRQ